MTGCDAALTGFEESISMRPFEKKDSQGLMTSVLMAYLVLVLHVLLIAGLGFLVFFFRGIINYMVWIFLGGTVAILASAYLFYRRMKAEGRTLRQTLNSPIFRGRTVEVSFLGGLASFRLGKQDAPKSLGNDGTGEVPQLEDPERMKVRELTELARLLENDLITIEEYNQFKRKLFES